MRFLDRLKQKRLERQLIAAVSSADWAVAESAIKRIPEVLDIETALSLLLPLSRGEGKRMVDPLQELPPTPTYQFTTGVHLGAAIEALGRMPDARATARLLALISELPNFASQALDALGSPRHACAALQLEKLAADTTGRLRHSLKNAVWHMGTEEALEAYIRIDKADGSAFSEETTRKAWASRQEELRNLQAAPKHRPRPLPLPG
jgi:hypothetical protein